MAYSVNLLPTAVEELAEIPPRIRKQIWKKIERLKADLLPPGAKILNSNHTVEYRRIKSGDYRIIYTVQKGAGKNSVVVVKVGNRRDVYRFVR